MNNKYYYYTVDYLGKQIMDSREILQYFDRDIDAVNAGNRFIDSEILRRKHIGEWKKKDDENGFLLKIHLLKIHKIEIDE